MTITYTVKVDSSAGVDTSLFFLGTRAVTLESYAVGTESASQNFDIQSSPGQTYTMTYYGSNIKSDPDVADFSMDMTSASLFSDQNSTIPLIDMQIDFGDSGMTSTPLLSGTYFTQDNLLNFFGSSSYSLLLSLVGNAGPDKLYGSARGDILNGEGGADRMAGHDGNDRYYVDNAADVVVETPGEGSDYVLTSVSYGLKAGVEVEKLSTTATSGSAAINLTGNELGQAIYGNEAANKIVAMGGSDTVYAYGGNDALYGGDGKDTLTGGLGNDQFVFDTALGSSNIDTIADFHNVSGDNDTMRLDHAIFTKLPTGALNAAYLAANAAGKALDANDYVVYDTDSGALFYDADGSGAGKAIQFATLTGHPALTAADFLIV